MTVAATTGRWWRRTIDVLVDTGRTGDASPRRPLWTVLSVFGPGSVPFALLMFGVQQQVLRDNYALGGLSLPLALGPAVGIVLARYRPTAAWAVLFTSFAATAARTPVRESDPWPWTVVGLFALLIVLFALARDRRAVTTITVWALTFGSGLSASLWWRTETARQNLILVSLLTAAAVAVGLSVRMTRRARQRVSEEEQLTAAERARRNLLEERARIARELHDVVAHHMSVISVQSSTAEYRLDDLPETAREEFRSISDQARDALTELRRLLSVLRSEDESVLTAPQPGLNGLTELTESVRRAGIEVELDVTETQPPPDTIALTAYRIVQEALSNVVRYAPGATTRVTVTATTATVSVEVENDPPKRPGADPGGAGLGLAGMRERVTLLGGELNAGPTGAGGFAVHATLPVRTDPARRKATG